MSWPGTASKEAPAIANWPGTATLAVDGPGVDLTPPPPPILELPLPQSTVFDPEGAGALDVLSNGGLTVTNPTSNGAGSFVRSTRSAATGKLYAEFIINVVGSGGMIGIADTAISLNANGSFILANNTRTIGIPPDGNVYNGSGFGTIGNLGSSYTTGDVIGIAIDIAARQIWYRKNGGAWNDGGTANPATGVGGKTWNAALTGPVHLAVGVHQGASITLNGKPASVPAGFAPWVTPIDIDAMIVAGQSNAAGSQIDTTIDYQDDPNVLAWNGAALVLYKPNSVTGWEWSAATSKWAAEARYAQLYRQANPAKRLAIVKVVASGTQLFQSADGNTTSDWNVSSSNELFANFGVIIANARAALVAAGYNPVVRLLWWQQGENDANATMAASYQTNLAALVAGFRNASGNWKVPSTAKIAIGRLSSQYGNATYRNQIRAAQKAVCDADVGGPQWLVNDDDLALEGDFTHLVKASQLSLGDRLWQVDVGSYVEPVA